MKIEWLGMSCFKIQTKNGNQESTLVIEPYDPQKCGKRLPRSFGATLLLKNPDNQISLGKDPFVIDSEGEFEHNGVFVYAMAHFQKKDEKIIAKKLLFRIKTEGISLVHLGELDSILDNGLLEKLQGADILLVSIGRKRISNEPKVQEIISQVEPKIVIPMNYSIKQLNPAIAKSLESVEKFAKELEVNRIGSRLKITSKNLPADKMEVYILDPI